MGHHGTYYATCMKRQGGGADRGVGIGCLFGAGFWLLAVALIVWWAA